MLNQSPLPGILLGKGDSVDLTVSKGIEYRTVPPLVRPVTCRCARPRSQRQKLQVGTSTQQHSPEPAGTVLASRAQAGRRRCPPARPSPWWCPTARCRCRACSSSTRPRPPAGSARPASTSRAGGRRHDAAYRHWCSRRHPAADTYAPKGIDRHHHGQPPAAATHTDAESPPGRRRRAPRPRRRLRRSPPDPHALTGRPTAARRRHRRRAGGSPPARRARGTRCGHRVRRSGEPVGQHQVAALGEHRLGVELHALDASVAVAHRHHDAAGRAAGDLELVGHGVPATASEW